MVKLRPNSHRHFWQAVGFLLAGFAFLNGTAYAFEGNHQTTSPSLYVLERIPGHMHTHGAILIVIGAALIYELLNLDDFARRPALRLFCGYCILVATTIFGSWWITGKPNYAAPWSWVIFAGISGAMIYWPPPLKVPPMRLQTSADLRRDGGHA